MGQAHLLAQTKLPLEQDVADTPEVGHIVLEDAAGQRHQAHQHLPGLHKAAQPWRPYNPKCPDHHQPQCTDCAYLSISCPSVLQSVLVPCKCHCQHLATPSCTKTGLCESSEVWSSVSNATALVWDLKADHATACNFPDTGPICMGIPVGDYKLSSTR